MEYKTALSQTSAVGYEAESLVVKFCDLISRADSELLVVMPYWSHQGVDELRSRLKIEKRDNFVVTIITPNNPDQRDAEGIEAFKDLMKGNYKAVVKHFVPKKLDSGYTPFMHAKVIVSDRKYGYVGSANLSNYGLNKSIEMGVSLTGTPALHAHEWFESILQNMTPIE